MLRLTLKMQVSRFLEQSDLFLNDHAEQRLVEAHRERQSKKSQVTYWPYLMWSAAIRLQFWYSSFKTHGARISCCVVVKSFVRSQYHFASFLNQTNVMRRVHEKPSLLRLYNALIKILYSELSASFPIPYWRLSAHRSYGSWKVFANCCSQCIVV